MPARYSAIDENRGGLWDTSQTSADSWAIFYVQVRTCTPQSTVHNSSARRVAVPVIDNGMIEFAHLADPLGNRFGIWQRKDAQ